MFWLIFNGMNGYTAQIGSSGSYKLHTNGTGTGTGKGTGTGTIENNGSPSLSKCSVYGT